MPRKNRRNADYFPHPARPGPVEDLMQRRWGNDGYAILHKTLELLTDADEHYLDLSSPARMELYAGYMQAPPDVILQVLNSLSNLKFIDPELWQGYRVIWCEQLVGTMLAEVYRKRESDAPKCPDTALLTQLRGNPAQNSLFLENLPPETTQEKDSKDSKEREKSGARSAESEPVDEPIEFYYATRRAGKRRKLTGRALWWFKIFWECYGYKHNRADAVGAWLDLEWPGGKGNDEFAQMICVCAISEENKRWEIIDRGLTPIYAQGWLSANRFEEYEQKYDSTLKKHGSEVVKTKLANKVLPSHLDERPGNWK